MLTRQNFHRHAVISESTLRTAAFFLLQFPCSDEFVQSPVMLHISHTEKHAVRATNLPKLRARFATVRSRKASFHISVKYCYYVYDLLIRLFAVNRHLTLHIPNHVVAKFILTLTLTLQFRCKR